MSAWRRLIGLVAFVTVCACAPTAEPPTAPVPTVEVRNQVPPSEESAGTLELIDFTDDFARIHDRDAALPDAERVARFKAEFAKLLPGFYDAERVGLPADKYDEFLLRALKRFPEQRAGISRVSSEFRGLLAPAQRSFEAEFGPMTGFPPINLVHSLTEFDGGTRTLPGGSRLMFGADMIDQIYKTTPIQPFFHHELFHLLHQRTFNDCEPVWCALWKEGLAVYVASRLNPGATDAALLLTFPVPLRPAVENNRAAALCYVAARLDSLDKKDMRALFSGGSPDGAALPPRFGYYVGYLVAAEIGRSRSLKQLAALDREQADPLVRSALAAMATCPSQKPVHGERG